MYLLGKILTWLASPLTVGLAAMLIAWMCAARGRRRISLLCGALALAWLLVWSSPAFCLWLESRIERAYPPLKAEDTAAGDAIVVLGGGMSGPRGGAPYAEMFSAADRVWHAARLFHAGKAPIVIPSGLGEESATVPLLRDLGVPATAIHVESESLNTAANARRTKALLDQLGCRRVILVTSAFHMRRARYLFEAAGVSVIPAATDYEALVLIPQTSRDRLASLLPSADMLVRSSVLLKEYLGYWACRISRRCRTDPAQHP